MIGKDLPKNVRGRYPNDVPFNMRGFPDFSRYAQKTVNVGSFTSDTADFRSANEAAFGKGNPYGSDPPPRYDVAPYRTKWKATTCAKRYS
jgi:hypothetical protein